MGAHQRTASASSDILSAETMSSMQRCVFGKVFRSQRQLVRFSLFAATFIVIMYLINPFGSTEKHVVPQTERQSLLARRSVQEDEEKKTVPADSEYRATFFEDMGKRFAGREFGNNKIDMFHFSNDLQPAVADEAEAAIARAELKRIAEKVKTVAEVISKCRSVPGMAMVLVKGKDAVQIPLGLADVAANRSVTTETKFLLNSISKTFLGQLLAVLISEGAHNVTWDSRVADILGEEFQLVTKELTGEVTLRDVLSHRTGLSSGNLAVRATCPDGWTEADIVKNLRHLPTSAPFRKTFLYSNMASLLAVAVVERLGGAPWEKLLADKLLVPLGMLGTKPLRTRDALEGKDVSRFYVPLEGKVTLANSDIYHLGPFAAVALLSSSAADMAKWLQFNLAEGQLPSGRRLIGSEVWAAMGTKQTDLSPMFLASVDKSGDQWPVKDRSLGYGLFWFLNKYRGFKNLWHGGGLYSHHTLAWTFPEGDAALHVVINGHHPRSKPFAVVEALAYYAADLLLGHKPWLDAQSVCTYPQPWLPAPVAGGNGGSAKNQTGGVRGEASEGKKDKNVEGGQDSLSRVGESGRNVLLGLPNEKDGKNLSEGGNRGNNVLLGLPGGEKKNVDATDQLKKLSPPGNTSMGSKDPDPKGSAPLLPLKAYVGLFHQPLFGQLSVSLDSAAPDLKCALNLLTGVLRPVEGHTFGVELTGSLRFYSKPSQDSPAKSAFLVDFVVSAAGEVTAVDVHSSWAMEVPIRFERTR